MELINNTNKETTTTAQNTRTYGKKKPVKPSLKFLIIKKRPKCVCLRKYRDLIECVQQGRIFLFSEFQRFFQSTQI
jgi:hypothetical protein